MTHSIIKRDETRQFLSRLENFSGTSTYLEIRDVLEQAWERGYQYAQREIKEDLQRKEDILFKRASTSW